jgi:hypothetical protein
MTKVVPEAAENAAPEEILLRCTSQEDGNYHCRIIRKIPAGVPGDPSQKRKGNEPAVVPGDEPESDDDVIEEITPDDFDDTSPDESDSGDDDQDLPDPCQGKGRAGGKQHIVSTRQDYRSRKPRG